MRGFLSQALFVPVLLLLGSSCTDVRLHDLGGPWQMATGQAISAPGAEPADWQTVDVPRRFREAGAAGARPQWLSLRRRLPAAVGQMLARGEPVAFSSGLISDVAIFYLNGRVFAQLGSVEPYRSALYRQTLTVLPDFSRRGAPAATGYTPGSDWELALELYAPPDRPLHFEGPRILVGPANVLSARYF